MARVFLDTNYFIDAVVRQPEKQILKTLIGRTNLISFISVAVYCYLFKIKVPNEQLSIQLEEFQLVELTQAISEKALLGPTNDLEDNIQLHSAAEAECDIFLTSDKKLLQIKFFGKTQILSEIPNSF